MGSLFLGLIIGWTTSLLAASVAGFYAYKRVVLLERRTRQAERLAELGTLTGGLAHEIKNPLSTVQLNLQLLQEDLVPQNPAYPRLINRLNTVKNETSRLRDILDDFLRYAGRLEVVRKPLELNNVLEELVDFFTPQAQLNRVQLRLKKYPTEVVAQVDPKLIKQALLNLILNALQAMPNGGEVMLSARKADGNVVLDVIDTGPGIDAAARDRVFDAYYSKRKGGTGLGLAITKRIVEEHGGRISVISEPGKGADFRIEVPMGEEE